MMKKKKYLENVEKALAESFRKRSCFVPVSLDWQDRVMESIRKTAWENTFGEERFERLIFRTACSIFALAALIVLCFAVFYNIYFQDASEAYLTKKIYDSDPISMLANEYGGNFSNEI